MYNIYFLGDPQYLDFTCSESYYVCLSVKLVLNKEPFLPEPNLLPLVRS